HTHTHTHTHISVRLKPDRLQTGAVDRTGSVGPGRYLQQRVRGVLLQEGSGRALPPGLHLGHQGLQPGQGAQLHRDGPRPRNQVTERVQHRDTPTRPDTQTHRHTDTQTHRHTHRRTHSLSDIHFPSEAFLVEPTL
ncbi:hypothetical protein ANANG_G00242910, partial [Anguilla anguilla]